MTEIFSKKSYREKKRRAKCYLEEAPNPDPPRVTELSLGMLTGARSHSLWPSGTQVRLRPHAARIPGCLWPWPRLTEVPWSSRHPSAPAAPPSRASLPVGLKALQRLSSYSQPSSGKSENPGTWDSQLSSDVTCPWGDNRRAHLALFQAHEMALTCNMFKVLEWFPRDASVVLSYHSRFFSFQYSLIIHVVSNKYDEVVLSLRHFIGTQKHVAMETWSRRVLLGSCTFTDRASTRILKRPCSA